MRAPSGVWRFHCMCPYDYGKWKQAGDSDLFSNIQFSYMYLYLQFGPDCKRNGVTTHNEHQNPRMCPSAAAFY